MKEQSSLQKCLSKNNYNTDNYSGRGMFNKQCLSTIVQADSLNSALLTVAVDVIKASHSLLDSNDIDGSDFDDILDSVKSAKVDCMGKWFVVYFPTVQYHDVSEELETEE